MSKCRRSSYMAQQPYEEIDRIRRGDIIRLGAHLRTVRRVHRYESDHVWMIEVAKVKRSQYRCPTTLKLRHEVRESYGGILAHRKDPELCATDLECRVQRQVDHGIHGIGCTTTQEETVGVIW